MQILYMSACIHVLGCIQNSDNYLFVIVIEFGICNSLLLDTRQKHSLEIRTEIATTNLAK